MPDSSANWIPDNAANFIANQEARLGALSLDELDGELHRLLGAHERLVDHDCINLYAGTNIPNPRAPPCSAPPSAAGRIWVIPVPSTTRAWRMPNSSR